MKHISIAALCAAALIPGLVQAAPPPSDALLRGAIRAAADFCTRIDPEHEERIERRARALRGEISKEHDKTSKEHAEEISQSPAFQQGYRLFESALNEAPPEDARRICADLF
jgi:hypothetical protein